MKNVRIKYVIAILCGILLCSCTAIRYIPEGSYMLTENKIETDKSTPKDERVSSSDIDRYIRQNPAKKFLGMNVLVWIYNQANPEKSNWWNKLLRRLGEEPVIFDSTLTILSDRNIKQYLNSRGFYDSQSDFAVRYKQRRRKAYVSYAIHQGEPYRIKSINYDYKDKFLEQVIRQDSSAMLIRGGEVFDVDILNQERQRITSYLKNQGYYNFSINNINYIADTTTGSREVDLTMVFKQHLAGYDADGKPIMENNSIYRISDIYVYPNYNPTKAAIDPQYLLDMDTTFYQGLRIVGDGKPLIRPRTLRRAIPVYNDYTYSYSDIRRTSDNLLRLNYFKNASVIFSVPDKVEQNQLTYVGGNASEEGPVHTSEKDLVCNIYCVPGLKQGYTIDFEATTSSAFYALRPSVSYLNRNVFKGAELLNISLSGGYEFNRDKQATQNSYEIGASASLTFPRFFTPFPIDRAGKLFRPQTKVEIHTNLQRKSKYGRVITGANLGYSWGNGRNSSYTFRPLDLNVVKVNYIDNDFLCDIQNTYLRESYKSQYISAISGSYLYNNPNFDSKGYSLTIRVNAETAGNVAGAIAHWFNKPVTEQINLNDCGGSPENPVYEKFHKIFGIRYSQYARTDISVSSTVALGGRLALAYRFYGGIGIPYGNSSSIPMDRMFYVGGSNSMRGWVVRTLGPGNSADGHARGFNNQLGNVRLEGNVEFRFPIWGGLNGALFFDVGNIWVTKIPGAQPDEIFQFDSFYKQLGFNTGLGLRYDLSLVIIRLDWGIKLHDPSMPAGQRWIRDFRLNNTVLNFGIGYPF